jgi:iron complex transport system ATP-binding protein
MLQARGLTYRVDGHTLLSGADIDVAPGRVTVLIGPNGAGKSTLLRILCGELKPTSGNVLLDRRALGSFSAAELARRRAVVPQSSVLAFPFTVIEVAMLGVSVPGFGNAPVETRAAALAALDAVGLREIAGRLYLHLSGGERQRVHIARALAQLNFAARRRGETHCFLLDEPTSSLDLAHQSLVLTAIRAQAQRGLAAIAVLHDLNLAATLADDLVLMVEGRIVAAGSPATVLTDELLSAAYGCRVLTNRTPGEGRSFVLPPATFTVPGTSQHVGI